MKKILVLIAVVGISLSAAAQNYNYGIGLRLGYSPSIDFKWNHSVKNSLEFNLEFPAFNGLSASVAYEWNWPIGPQGYNGKGFNGYAGPAVGLGFWGMTNGYNGGFMAGIGGMGGIEYKFGIPLALAIDYKPMFTFVTNQNRPFQTWGFYDFALAIRYAF